MLQVSGITKHFGERRVLDDVTFAVDDGRLTGFVGANGAGKTTTMRIIIDLLRADAGTVTLDGQPITGADRRRIGYMPEERGLYPKMRVLEQIVYFARLHGFTPSAARRNGLELLERLELAERKDDLVEALSLGNQQRAQIAAALVHQPEVLILDEPFSGLDPVAVQTVQGVLTDQAAAGAPVLFSSHQLDIVERLCDNLVIIADGRIRANGSRQDLHDRYGTKRFELRLDGDVGWLRDVPDVRVIEFDGGWAVFEADTDAARQRVLTEALTHGSVEQFTREQRTLAEIFTEVIR